MKKLILFLLFSNPSESTIELLIMWILYLFLSNKLIYQKISKSFEKEWLIACSYSIISKSEALSLTKPQTYPNLFPPIVKDKLQSKAGDNWEWSDNLKNKNGVK